MEDIEFCRICGRPLFKNEKLYRRYGDYYCRKCYYGKYISFEDICEILVKAKNGEAVLPKKTINFIKKSLKRINEGTKGKFLDIDYLNSYIDDYWISDESLYYKDDDKKHFSYGRLKSKSQDLLTMLRH